MHVSRIRAKLQLRQHVFLAMGETGDDFENVDVCRGIGLPVDECVEAHWRLDQRAHGVRAIHAARKNQANAGKGDIEGQ